jgi:hypothetical protein
MDDQNLIIMLYRDHARPKKGTGTIKSISETNTSVILSSNMKSKIVQ